MAKQSLTTKLFLGTQMADKTTALYKTNAEIDQGLARVTKELAEEKLDPRIVV